MNELVISELARDLNITVNQIKTVLNLFNEGATIPFIARYRKEATGALDENQIKSINDLYTYYNNLLDRKEAVIRLIDEKGMLTEELKQQILSCSKLTEVEDLYRPYKEKKKTKASEAINMGLEPLAKMIMAFPTTGSLEDMAKKYINDKVKTTEDAITNACYIIAEWISDNASYRKWIRNYIYNNGLIVSEIKKNAEDPKKTFEMYYNFSEPVKYIKHYRVLAINRGEKEKILNVNIDFSMDEIMANLKRKIIKNDKSFVCSIIEDTIKDALKRLIISSVEREIRSELTEKADALAIENFSVNLEHLLLTRPIKGMIVLGFDPGYVNGCKLAVVDQNGTYMDSCVIKPFLKNISESELKKYKEIVKNLVEKYKVDIISIGNGTAS